MRTILAAAAWALLSLPFLASANAWLQTGRVLGTEVIRTQGSNTFVLAHGVPGTSVINNAGTFNGRRYFSQTQRTGANSSRTSGAGTFFTTTKIPGTNLYRTSGYLNGREIFNISSTPGLNGQVSIGP